MSTRQTDWGTPDVRGENAAPGSSPSGASAGLFGTLTNFVRSTGFGKLLTPGKIGDLSNGVAGGIDMNRLNRSMLGPLRSRTSGLYSVTTTSWVELDNFNLAGVMTCTGRPVVVALSAGVNSGTATGVTLSVTLDGNEVTGKGDGMCWDFTGTDQFLYGWHLITPAAGRRRLAVVAKISGAGTATVYADAADEVKMLAVEL